MMACIEDMLPANAESEMEEGEIIDDFDYLSDISSEEEFLLRQRLQVLENYNNVLERKKAKSSPVIPGKKNSLENLLPNGLSEISASDNEETVNKNNNEKYSRPKKRKEQVIHCFGKQRDVKKKNRSKKKVAPKVIESSEESDDEYRNKRRKLANAVVVHTPKSDSTSLRARLKKMFGTQSQEPVEAVVKKQSAAAVPELHPNLSISKKKNKADVTEETRNDKPHNEVQVPGPPKLNELIDLCDDENDDVIIACNDVNDQDTVDSGIANGSHELGPKKPSEDSDEDLELLRQHALKTKTPKTITEVNPETENKPFNLLEDEDSDTAELRLICLKSALLKKAIEMKQKQKKRKRLSQSFHDELDIDHDKLSKKVEVDNNTDTESVDMDIGSDGDEKLKVITGNCNLVEELKHDVDLHEKISILNDIPIPEPSQKDEIDDDEDLLRAKLLTSLSKNWPNIVEPNVMESMTNDQSPEAPPSTAKSKSTNMPEAKPFIISLAESDSEGEHEATKNLKKMHMKLSEKADFEQKLDLFLKSTRMEVEKQTLPDVVLKAPEQPKPAPKYVAKTVIHLPKSEQIEYKNLVRRMAELEKMKQARQMSMNLNKITQPKETLKPRNISVEAQGVNTNINLDEQIAISRKNIAMESAKMLKLKEVATTLSQKYKIAATELRNISTAISLNKREQRSIQNKLAKIRLQHQILLKSSTSNKHSKTNIPLVNRAKMLSTTKLQKENNPSDDEYKNLLKSVKVSVVNDLKEENLINERLSVQIDVSSNNKKVVKIPNNPTKDKVVNVVKHTNSKVENIANVKNPIVEKGGGKRRNSKDIDVPKHNADRNNKDIDDYKSPLDAGTWEEDPNSFLCPFEVGGTCKDPDCKYLHPKIPTEQ